MHDGDISPHIYQVVKALSHILDTYMNKILVSSLAAIIALGANVAFAQGYYYPAPSYNYGSAYQAPYSGACVNVASDLSYGSRGSQVSQLQTFLVNQNFPGGGSWMITGYFGNATLAAVRNFQQQQGLPISGVVDAATRAAISRVSCGYSMYNYNYNTSPYTASPFYSYTTTNASCYYTYPYTCNNSYGRVVSSSLSPTYGQPGTSVTIYGSGFDYSNNTVYFGMIPLANIPSYNGTTLTFTVPSYSSGGTVGVFVVSTRGTSNTLNFSVTGGGCTTYPYNCCAVAQNTPPYVPGQGYVFGYPYQNQSQYGYQYCPPQGGTPTITYLSPQLGAVGSSVTVYGTGFSLSGNSVHFGGGIIANLSSSNGTSITFTVPSQLYAYGSQAVTPGPYSVSVTNTYGYTSNAVSFTVTSSGYYGAPTVSSINGPTRCLMCARVSTSAKAWAFRSRACEPLTQNARSSSPSSWPSLKSPWSWP